MQRQGSNSSSSGSGSEGEQHEAVIRELTRGHELTAQLREEALRVLRGHGQAEATAALILQEVSRAFTVCLSIMTTSPSHTARAPPPSQPPLTTVEMAAAAPAALPARRGRDDSIPREQLRTSSRHHHDHDGYQWRKYGQKRITRARFPRCYFRCSFHRERNCRATKQVQQCSDGDPPQYVVMYFNDHTCDTTAWEPSSSAAAAANSVTTTLEDFLSVSGLPVVARHGHGLLLDERGVLQEEHERQLLVSSLARVLGGQPGQLFQQQSSPSSAADAVAAVNVVGHGEHHQEQEQEPLPPPRASTRDAPGEMPRASIVGGVDGVAAGLDVTDYDVTDALCFGGDSYDLPVPDDDGFPF